MSSLNVLAGKQAGFDLLEELLSEFSPEELDSVARQGAIFTDTATQRPGQRSRDSQAKRFPFPASSLNTPLQG